MDPNSGFIQVGVKNPLAIHIWVMGTMRLSALPQECV